MSRPWTLGWEMKLLFPRPERAARTCLTGDRETLVRSAQVIAEGSTHSVRTILATAGDRLALEHTLHSGRGGGSEFELEHLRVSEVDAEGRAVAILLFDPEDRAAAADEMAERYAARGAPAPLRDWIPALPAHNPARIRALLPDDFECHDHRRTGLGRLDVDAYVASLTALWQEASNARIEFLCELARSEHGRPGGVTLVRRAPDGRRLRVAVREPHLLRGRTLDPPRDLAAGKRQMLSRQNADVALDFDFEMGLGLNLDSLPGYPTVRIGWKVP